MDYFEYEPRYVAYLDILGFSEIIRKMDTTTDEQFNRIYFLLHTHQFSKIDLDIEVADFQSTSFSDNVVVSAPTTANGLAALVLFCFSFSWRLLMQGGYFCRGAIVKGPLHHRDSIVFGSALIDAYKIENEIADVPRVIIRRDVITDIESLSPKQEFLRNFKGQIRRCDDGPFMINFLTPISQHTNLWTDKAPAAHVDAYVSPEEDERYLRGKREQVKCLIEQRLDSATDNPRIYRKLKWVASQYNKEVAGTDRSLTIYITENI